MLKKTNKYSTAMARRVRVARSVATSHADTATGPRPIVPRPSTAATERGPSRRRVRPPEQPTGPLPHRSARPHSQDREVRMSTNHGNPSVPAAAPYVGIDVSKEKLDLARTDDLKRVVSFPNDPAGIARIVELLTALKPAAVVVESTGSLERPLLEALLEANLPASLVHPGRVRYFAIGLGILAKTDPIDARVLAKFAELASPRLSEKRSKNEAELRDLVACRRQLCQARAQQYNRRCSTFSKASLRSVDSVIAAMDKQIEALDRQIRDLIDADDEFKTL